MPGTVAFMVVMIVLIGMVGKVMKERYRAMGAIRQDTTLSADQMRADQELARLKERIAVLERVVTENHGSLDLDRQIERLRDR